MKKSGFLVIIMVLLGCQCVSAVEIEYQLHPDGDFNVNTNWYKMGGSGAYYSLINEDITNPVDIEAIYTAADGAGALFELTTATIQDDVTSVQVLVRCRNDLGIKGVKVRLYKNLGGGAFYLTDAQFITGLGTTFSTELVSWDDLTIDQNMLDGLFVEVAAEGAPPDTLTISAVQVNCFGEGQLEESTETTTATTTPTITPTTEGGVPAGLGSVNITTQSNLVFIGTIVILAILVGFLLRRRRKD